MSRYEFVTRTKDEPRRRAAQAVLPILELEGLAEWRGWLANHSASSPGVWLMLWKGGDRNRSIDYDDAVREALCAGWIDSLIK